MASASNPQTVIAFDLYGTILSTESIARELAEHFGPEKGDSIAALWRRYQLEYSWRLNSMLIYKPFSQVTRLSLQHALAESSVSLSETQINDLMTCYDSLSPFPDVLDGLSSLSSTTLFPVVFSNGSPPMLKSSLASPHLTSHASVFQKTVSTSSVDLFKPNPEVYQYLAKECGKSLSVEDMEDVWLVSGNPFDVTGAIAAGINACWVDRKGGGWIDKLGEAVGVDGPTIIVKDLAEAIRQINEWSENRKGNEHQSGKE